MSSESTPAKSSYLKSEDIIGKSVVSRNAMVIGTVKELALSVDGKVGLHIARKDATGSVAEDLIISSDEIQAMGDVVLIKTTSEEAGKGIPAESQVATTAVPVLSPPPAPGTAQQQGKRCARCGYLNGASSRFCIKCGASLQ